MIKKKKQIRDYGHGRYAENQHKTNEDHDNFESDERGNEYYGKKSRYSNADGSYRTKYNDDRNYADRYHEDNYNYYDEYTNEMGQPGPSRQNRRPPYRPHQEENREQTTYEDDHALDNQPNYERNTPQMNAPKPYGADGKTIHPRKLNLPQNNQRFM